MPDKQINGRDWKKPQKTEGYHQDKGVVSHQHAVWVVKKMVA